MSGTRTVRLLMGTTPESDNQVARLRALLSDDERARLDRIRLEHVRRRQMAALAGLRIALGDVLDRDPATLRFERGPQGKPYLEDQAVSFNLTRSRDRFAIGIADHGALGVDIEFSRAIPRLAGLAETVFTELELEEMTALAEEERLAAFFRGWTRKEAFMKAVGMGLSLPLLSFAVSLAPQPGNALRVLEEPARRATELAGGDGADWWVAPVMDRLPDGLFAAIAWDRGEPTIAFETFDWE